MTLRAAAGRITRNVSRKSNQWNAVAAASANNVATVRVVILSKAIMEASLSYVRDGIPAAIRHLVEYRSVMGISNVKILWAVIHGDAAHTRRVMRAKHTASITLC